MRLEHQNTIFSGGFSGPVTSVSLGFISVNGSSVLQAINFGSGMTNYYALDPVLGLVFQNQVPHGSGRVSLSVGDTGGSVLNEVLDVALQDGDDQNTFLLPGTQYNSSTVLVSAQIDGQQYMFASVSSSGGVTVFELNPDNTLVSVGSIQDTADGYVSGVSAMAVVQSSGTSFLYVGSALEHGISGFEIGLGGALLEREAFGKNESLPVQTVTALESVNIDGTPYLVAAAAGSSSLTVLAVNADGSLTAIDHIIDTLDTRFAGVTMLEVVEAEGRVFVLAAGSDSGLSLFLLSGEGQLVHLYSQEDTLEIGLDGVSGLAATQVGDQLFVYTTAEGEAGLTVFSVDLSKAGIVQSADSGLLTGSGLDDILTLKNGDGQIWGGAGDDMLFDGAGADRLSGGPGADTFIFRTDLVHDIVEDFQLTLDSITLDGWQMLYDISQLDLSLTVDGHILINFGDESLEIIQNRGVAFTEDDYAALNLTIQTRIEIIRGALESDVEPEPDPMTGQAILGTSLNDTLLGTNGNDFIEGLEGGDRLDGLEGDDTIFGHAGNDAILGRGGNDTIYGGDGNDNIAASSGDDLVFGGSGNDALGGGYGMDELYGEDGNDTIGGGAGHDLIGAGAGNDVASGGWGRDVIYGGTGNDTLAGSYDADEVYGEAGDDSLGGGTGSDMIWGGAGNDNIGAGDDDDYLWGGTGRDFLGGGSGNDTLFGDQDDDQLNGGSGNDILTGGSGSDVFIFTDLNDGEMDIVTDFYDGLDLLRIHGINATGLQGRLDALSPTDTYDGVQLSYGGYVILLSDMFVDQLGIDDFIFV